MRCMARANSSLSNIPSLSVSASFHTLPSTWIKLCTREHFLGEIRGFYYLVGQMWLHHLLLCSSAYKCNSLHFFCWWFVQVFIRIMKLIWISPVTFPLSCSNVLKISSYFGLSFATTQPNSSDPSSTPTPPGMVDWNETIRIRPTGIHYRNFPEFINNCWLVHFSGPIIVRID